MEVLREHVERVEVVGLDEAYLDLTGIERPRAAARRVKAAIAERTGLSCSIGIGPNKLVAKMASDAEKPDGFVVLSQRGGAAAFRRRLAGAGAGHRPEDGRAPEGARHRHAGRAGGDARRRPRRAVRRPARPAPGVAGALRGRAPDRDRAGGQVRVARDHLRARPARPHGARAACCDQLTEELCATLGRSRQAGRTIGIKVRLDDFSTHTRARSLSEATNDFEVVHRVAIAAPRGVRPAPPGAAAGRPRCRPRRVELAREPARAGTLVS